MKLGVIADDFTGASDIALVLSENGFRSVLYNGVPENDDFSPAADAGIIALKTRTIDARCAVSQSLVALEWLIEMGVEQVIFKICSTFDSSRLGNIGPVTEALAKRLGSDRVLVCPSYPEGKRTVYQAHLFVDDRLLNESGMQNHPLTPMRDADVRRLMGMQASWPVEHVTLNQIREGGSNLSSLLMCGRRAHIVADAIDDSDLHRLARAAKGLKLITASAGIAVGLSSNFELQPTKNRWQGSAGRGVVLSGSCSATTRGQIERHCQTQPAFEVNVNDLMTGRLDRSSLVQWALSQSVTSSPLIYTSAAPDVVAAVHDDYAQADVANKIDQLFSELAGDFLAAGVERFVVAGGETSGAVSQALQARQMLIGPKIAQGVPAMRIAGSTAVLALKSGNFGDEDFFQSAMNALGSE